MLRGSSRSGLVSRPCLISTVRKSLASATKRLAESQETERPLGLNRGDRKADRIGQKTSARGILKMKKDKCEPATPLTHKLRLNES